VVNSDRKVSEPVGKCKGNSFTDSNKNYKGIQMGSLWRMRAGRCPTYNAIQNNKFVVKNCNKIK
jgi:hypothetical protein